VQVENNDICVFFSPHTVFAANRRPWTTVSM